jgi:hypothetical protein
MEKSEAQYLLKVDPDYSDEDPLAVPIFDGLTTFSQSKLLKCAPLKGGG